MKYNDPSCKSLELVKFRPVMFSAKDSRVVDETSWTNVDSVRFMDASAAFYFVSKTLTERAALEFAETHGFDLVTLNPTYIHGPFITPHCPGSVRVLMSTFLGRSTIFSEIVILCSLLSI